MPIWKYTDEDSDWIELIQRAEPGQYLFEMNDGHMVFINEEELFRLRDVIEKISTS